MASTNPPSSPHVPPSLLRVACLALMLSACGSAPSPMAGPPGCDEQAYASLVAGEVAALVYACADYASLDDCPAEIQGPITDAYEKKLDAWAECK